MSERASRLCSVILLVVCGCSPEAQKPTPPVAETTGALSRSVACNTVSGPGLRRKNHYGVYHPATATFTLENRRPGWDETATEDSFVYGNANWKPLIGDWDGDGSETLGVWSAGTFMLKNSNSTGVADVTFNYGNATDVPLAGDWTGQKKTTVGVWRQGWWYLKNSNSTGTADIAFAFGNSDDVPVVGDWDGDGVDTIGVFRNGMWYLRNSNSTGPADIVVGYGGPGVIPIVGDWDEDGVDTIGIYDNGTLLLSNHNYLTGGVDNKSGINKAEIIVTLGAAGDIPLAGNWGSAGDGFSPGPLVLNGFFPLAADDQGSASFPHWKSLNMNTVIRVGPSVGTADTYSQWTQGARDNQMKMIRGASPNPADDDANLIALLYADEPEASFPPNVAAAQTAYNNAKTSNPQRPFVMNFAGELLQYTDDGRCNGPGDGASGDSRIDNCYPGFIGAEDWISHDTYPVFLYGGDLPIIGRSYDKLRRWGHAKPTFGYIELTAIKRDGVFSPQPTPDQVRAEIWISIVHGARGLFYFPHGGCDPCVTSDGVPADVNAEVTSQNATITMLSLILQGPINPGPYGVDAPAPLDAGWRSDGLRGIYLIVVNTSLSTVSKTITLCGITPSIATQVYGENRSVGSAGVATFTDTFGPGARHIYHVN